MEYTLVVVVCISNLHAEWLDFNAGSVSNSAPMEVFNESWEDYLTFDVELRGLTADTLAKDSLNYLRFSNTPGITLTDSTGLSRASNSSLFYLGFRQHRLII